MSGELENSSFDQPFNAPKLDSGSTLPTLASENDAIAPTSPDSPQGMVSTDGPRAMELPIEQSSAIAPNSASNPSQPEDAVTRRESSAAPVRSASSGATTWQSAVVSTMASLVIVLTLLAAVRFLLPPCLEAVRYGWYRGQLRAEYEAAGERLKSISFDGLSAVSEAVSQRVAPCVVHVDVRQRSSASQRSLQALLDSDDIAKQFLGQGSGVIVDRSGYILTNFHVLEDADAVEVLLSDRRRVRATIVGTDAATDLAVLKIEAPDLIAIEWGDSEQVTVGSSVWAVGSPFGLSGSITFGIISSKNRIDLSGTRYGNSNVVTPRYSDLLQSDVAVNPGNSGGPLVDFQGRLIGINTAILGESYRGVSFSIPSRVAKRCYEQIREKGSVERGWLGVELKLASRQSSLLSNVDESDKSLSIDNERMSSASVPLPGAVVLNFAKGNASPALRAGLRVGDRIVEFDGRPVRDADELIRLIGETNFGSKIPFKVIRGESLLELEVTLGRRPDTQP